MPRALGMSRIGFCAKDATSGSSSIPKKNHRQNGKESKLPSVMPSGKYWLSNDEALLLLLLFSEARKYCPKLPPSTGAIEPSHVEKNMVVRSFELPPVAASTSPKRAHFVKFSGCPTGDASAAM